MYKASLIYSLDFQDQVGPLIRTGIQRGLFSSQIPFCKIKLFQVIRAHLMELICS